MRTIIFVIVFQFFSYQAPNFLCQILAETWSRQTLQRGQISSLQASKFGGVLFCQTLQRGQGFLMTAKFWRGFIPPKPIVKANVRYSLAKIFFPILFVIVRTSLCPSYFICLLRGHLVLAINIFAIIIFSCSVRSI